MKKKKILTVALSLAILSSITVPKNLLAKENINNSRSKNSNNLNSFVRQIYAETSRVYGSYAEVKNAVYHEHRGFKGYIGLIKTIENHMGIVAYYGGYLYPGDNYPMPTKVKTKENLQSFSLPTTKKKVVTFKTYKEYLAIENRIFYDDGEFFGYIEATDAWQKNDWSWEVRYEGFVYNFPRSNTNLIEK